MRRTLASISLLALILITGMGATARAAEPFACVTIINSKGLETQVCEPTNACPKDDYRAAGIDSHTGPFTTIKVEICYVL